MCSAIQQATSDIIAAWSLGKGIYGLSVGVFAYTQVWR